MREVVCFAINKRNIGKNFRSNCDKTKNFPCLTFIMFVSFSRSKHNVRITKLFDKKISPLQIFRIQFIADHNRSKYRHKKKTLKLYLQTFLVKSHCVIEGNYVMSIFSTTFHDCFHAT